MQVLIDTSKKHASAIITTVSLALAGTVWSIFVRPQLVMASDLNNVAVQVENLDKKVDGLSDTVNTLAISLVESRVDYLQDRIRELEAKKHSTHLTSDEAYRLSEYKDRLENVKAVQAKIRAGTP